MINPLVYFLIFLKASLFSSGGLGNLPSLHQDLLGLGWAQETDFSKAVAIGQITPGPNGLWVIGLGYLSYGPLGAILALVAISLPPLLVLLIAAVYRRIEQRRWVRGVIRGLSLSLVSLLLVTVYHSLSDQQTDWRGWLIALVTAGLALSGRIHVVIILALAAGAGLFWLN